MRIRREFLAYPPNAFLAAIAAATALTAGGGYLLGLREAPSEADIPAPQIAQQTLQRNREVEKTPAAALQPTERLAAPSKEIFDADFMESLGWSLARREAVTKVYAQTQLKIGVIETKSAEEGPKWRERQIAAARRDLRNSLTDEEYMAVLYADGAPNQLRIAHADKGVFRNGDIVHTVSGKRVYDLAGYNRAIDAVFAARRGDMEVFRGGERLRFDLDIRIRDVEIVEESVLPTRIAVGQ
ncbi:MAG: hypothetical protein AAGD92_09020 [Pseudomonadota bacterium]